MTKIPVTFISSEAKLRPTIMLPQPIEVSETNQIRGR